MGLQDHEMLTASILQLEHGDFNNEFLGGPMQLVPTSQSTCSKPRLLNSGISTGWQGGTEASQT